MNSLFLPHLLNGFPLIRFPKRRQNAVLAISDWLAAHGAIGYTTDLLFCAIHKWQKDQTHRFI